MEQAYKRAPSSILLALILKSPARVTVLKQKSSYILCRIFYLIIYSTVYTVESCFLETPGKRKLVQEIGRFKKSGVKLEKSLSKGNENWFEKSGGLRN